MGEQFFFYIFAAITVVAILLMIINNNPIASAMCLVFAFFALSALYVLLHAPFVAIMQVLVYAGAIMVLFVFVIMMLRLRPEDLVVDRWNAKNLLLGGIGVFFVVVVIQVLRHIPLLAFQPVDPHFGSPEEVGRLIFGKYMIPFELISVTLLVALVGVVVLGKKEKS
ncbi:MAG TPA: hypothetical protein DDW49_03455 [Deltaproteobacteria bacterium]|nr:MAG: hypothetical protein A2048_08485 [Deltaproteobacteria bacterium GWA2_45_12]HBF12436.1 hypothetical protein [Deltaproteobacteria bacterium]